MQGNCGGASCDCCVLANQEFVQILMRSAHRPLRVCELRVLTDRRPCGPAQFSNVLQLGCNLANDELAVLQTMQVVTTRLVLRHHGIPRALALHCIQ